MLNLKDMIMLRLIHSGDFETIVSSLSTKEQIQKASDNFIMSIVSLCDHEDSVSLFRILHYTRFRLQNLQETHSRNELGKKCIGTTLCH